MDVAHGQVCDIRILRDGRWTMHDILHDICFDNVLIQYV